MVVDIARATEVLRSVLGELNLRNLDDDPAFEGRNTTTEFMARVIFDRVAARIAAGELGPARQRAGGPAGDAARIARGLGGLRGRAAGRGGSMALTARCSFLVPGDLGTRTGGYGYDRRIIDGLRAARLAGRRAVARARLSRCPMPSALAHGAPRGRGACPTARWWWSTGWPSACCPSWPRRHAQRLRWVALVHHPLALETGLAPGGSAALFESERRALASARGVIVTSPATARALAAFDVRGRAHHGGRAGHRSGAAGAGLGRGRTWRCCAWPA